MCSSDLNGLSLTPAEISLLPITVQSSHFLCRTRTNGKGEYLFEDVPVGLYVIVRLSINDYWSSYPFRSLLQTPISVTSSLIINFTPDQKTVTVNNKDLQIETPFETGTISFYGRVVKSSKSVRSILFELNSVDDRLVRFCRRYSFHWSMFKCRSMERRVVRPILMVSFKCKTFVRQAPLESKVN